MDQEYRVGYRLIIMDHCYIVYRYWKVFYLCVKIINYNNYPTNNMFVGCCMHNYETCQITSFNSINVKFALISNVLCRFRLGGACGQPRSCVLHRPPEPHHHLDKAHLRTAAADTWHRFWAAEAAAGQKVTSFALSIQLLSLSN